VEVNGVKAVGIVKERGGKPGIFTLPEFCENIKI
jgi:hypothetical protein